MSVTIKDIAKRAGVSYQTVSKALRDEKLISKATRQRVTKIAREMGYIRSSVARAMSSRSSGLVAVFVPQLATSFYHNIIQGIEATAQPNGYSVLLYVYENLNLEEKLNTILSYSADGAIIIENNFTEAFIGGFLKKRTPLIFVNSRNVPQGVSHIRMDNEYGIGLAMEHLHSLGHRSVFVAGASHTSGTARVEHAKRMGARLGMRIGVKWFKPNYRSADVYEGFPLERVLRDYTSVVCSSDYIALPVIRLCHERGIAVPKRLSVVGFDDLEFSEFLWPPLTTVGQPKESYGQRIFRALLNVIRGGATENISIFPELTVRASTRAVRSRRSR